MTWVFRVLEEAVDPTSKFNFRMPPSRMHVTFDNRENRIPTVQRHLVRNTLPAWMTKPANPSIPDQEGVVTQGDTF